MGAVSVDSVAQHLKVGLHSLYLIVGDEPLLQQEVGDAIRLKARQEGFTERSVHVVSNHFDWSDLLDAIGSQSLFADRNLIELRMPTGKPGKEGSALLQQVTDQIRHSSDVLLVIFLPRLDKATKSSAWYVALEKYGTLIAVETIARPQLPRWIGQRLALKGFHVPSGEAGQQCLQLFSDRVEGNLLAAHQEIEKLALLYPHASHQQPMTLQLQQLEETVLNVARYDVFKLSDAMLSGQSARTLRMLDGLEEAGESEVLAHYVISEDIRSLHTAKRFMDEGKPLPLALKTLRIWGDKERYFGRILPKIRATDLADCLQDAHVVDGIIKGVSNSDWPLSGWSSLRRLALTATALYQ